MKPLILLALALPLAAQFPLHLDLSGDWRLSDGDDPSYSQPEFNDSQWKPVPLPRQGSLPYGTHWLRRRVEIPPGTDTARLVLTLGSFMEDYEIHLNGRLVGRRGEFRLSRTYVARAQSFPVPPGIVAAGQPAVIALRFWRPVWTSSTGRGYDDVADQGPYLLSYRENAPREVAASGMMKRERLGVTLLVTSAFHVSFALLLLIAWLMERERKEMLYLIGFLIAEVLLRFMSYVSLIADWPSSHFSNFASLPALTLNGAFLTLLAMEVSGYRRRWLQVAVWLPTLFHTGMNWIVWREDRGFAGYFAWQQISSVLTALVDLAAIGILTHSLWRNRRDGRWTDGKTILRVAIMLAAFIHIPGYGAAYSRPLQVVWLAGGYSWNSYQIASVLVTVAMTFLVLHRLGVDRREKMRLSGEVAAARIVQESQIGSPNSVATPGFVVEAAYLPASEVGGDFYFVLPDPGVGSLLVVVGDVSGKGLRAALLVGHISGTLSNERSRQPAEVLANLNQSLVGRVSGGFVTCCCARFDADGAVTVANAGHLAPYAGGREVEVEAGLPLGVVSGVEYFESSQRLDGQFMFMSDGVIEAENAQRELFGFDRTREISTKSAQEIAEATKAWGQNDDITVVTVRRIT